MEVCDDHGIVRFVEKPKDPAVIESLAVSPALEAELSPNPERRGLASMGIYVFNRHVLELALDNAMTDFGKEVIPDLLGKRKLFAHLFEGYWEDIGSVRAFFEANLALAQPLPPFNFYDPSAPIYTHPRFLPASKVNRCQIDHAVIGDGCIITDSSLKRSVLGVRCVIGEGSHVEDSVLMGNDEYFNRLAGRPRLGIGRNCRISGAIVDKNTRIGDGCVLSPQGKADGSYAGGSVIIRDGVLVVPKNAHLPSGTMV